MEVKFLKKKYQEKWENVYMTVKGSPASGALSGSKTPSLQSNVSAKPNEEIKTLDFLRWRKGKITFIKMIRIFHVEIDIC